MSLRTLRRLVQKPGFAAMAIVTLAIGIGANSAIFSVINGVLLKPLPFSHPEQLIDLNHTAPGVHLTKAGSAPFLYLTYKDEAKTLQNVGLWRSDTDSLTELGEPEEIPTLDFTEDILAALQAQPMLGRAFLRADTTPGSPDTVIASYTFWQTKLGSDPNAVGRKILLDGRPREIIGVMPRTFQFLDYKPALLIPLQYDPAKVFLGNFSYQSIARLKPGVTLQQAQTDLEHAIPISLERFPPFPGFSLKMFQEAKLAPSLVPLKDSLLGDIGKTLWVLMSTVGMVLLIACANVANLMFVRAQGRQHELAIRTALGAGRWQIARELIGESMAVSVLGGVVGLGMAFAGLRTLIWLNPANLPRLSDIGIDLWTVLFTLLVSLMAGAFLGTILSFKYAAPQISLSIRAGGRSMSRGREHHRARNTLVVVQIALALVLLMSSGLMIRTFVNLRNVDPGFRNPEHLQIFGVYIPIAAVKEPEAVIRMEQAILDKLAAVPGVTSVAMTTNIPMTNDHWQDLIFAEDRHYTESDLPPLRRFKMMAPGVLATMGTPLVTGRDFTWSDLYDKHDVAMVSENFAREMWGSPQNAIGKRIRETMKSSWREIVGVVADVRDDGVDQKAPTSVWLPMMMANFEGDSSFIRRGVSYIVRSDRTGSSVFTGELGRAVWSVNPNLALADMRTMADIYRKSMARTSFALVMLAIAGGTALLLGLAGIYGVVSYSVTQRIREVGIRRALGAQKGEVAGLFVRQAAALAVIGIAIGVTVAVAVVRFMSSLLFNVTATDPLTYLAVALTLGLATILAAYIPALRATTVNPVDALRAE